ncbi:MAG TPA: 2Fe-2S iron-sulfur cluster-binding protein [Sporichthya sp.]|nr:2Fe-2S iron-sulfur cluster-binding protein [Sporichthya sp.]
MGSERAGIVRVAPDDIVVTAKKDEYILSALNRSGYGYRTGCRRGGCGICKADLLEGTVTYPVTVADEVLSPTEIADGVCLPCRAVPHGNVVVQLRDDRIRCTSSFLASLAARESRERTT